MLETVLPLIALQRDYAACYENIFYFLKVRTKKKSWF